MGTLTCTCRLFTHECTSIGCFLFLQNVIDKLVDPEQGETYQDALLSFTVNNPLVLQYPLKVEYQQSFMKGLVKQVNDHK